MGYAEVKLIDTTDGMFMNRSEAFFMELSGSKLFFFRFVFIFTVYKIYDMVCFDYFLLMKFQFFQYYYPETKSVYANRKYGYNIKSQLLKLLVIFPATEASLYKIRLSDKLQAELGDMTNISYRIDDYMSLDECIITKKTKNGNLISLDCIGIDKN